MPPAATPDLAIVMEPTDNAVEVGCLGNLNATVIVTGERRTARVRGRAKRDPPGGRGARPLADLPVRDVIIDGLTFREVVSAIAGGVAANVVPDHVEAGVNYRYAPGHAPAEAESRLRELLAPARVEVRIDGNAPPGAVSVRNPLVTRLREAGDLPLRPKQAWTPVAEFALAGVDAVNFGPVTRSTLIVTTNASRCTRWCDATRSFARSWASGRPPVAMGRRVEDVTHLSPGIRRIEPYPFEELDRRKADALGAGRELIDFGVGDPREVTAPFIRDALREAIEPTSSYPRAAGLPELRLAVSGWIGRRFGADVDPDTQVLPLLGSKEIVFSLAQATLDPDAGKDVVLVTAPGYTIPNEAHATSVATSVGCRCSRPTASSRISMPSTSDLDPDVHPVVELSEQPDRCGRAARLPPPCRGAMPPPRRAARLR